MKSFKLFTLFILLCMHGYSQDKPDLLDSLFSTMHQNGQFSGNVLIAQDNELVFSKSYGFSDRENSIPLTDQTLFNTGSVSKAFTAVAVLQLVDLGKISLNDNIIKYLPDFPYAEITVHDLLIHAGGLPDDYELLDHSRWEQKEVLTNEELMNNLYKRKIDLKFKPGEKSEYSNLGYVVLAQLVAKVAVLDFDEYLARNIFMPSNMKRTKNYNADEIKGIENVAKGYLLYPFTGRYEEAITIPEFKSNYIMSGLKGDGNVYSTTKDLFNFYKALSEFKLLTEKSFNLLFQKHIKAYSNGEPDFGNSFGYGWTIIKAPINIVQRGGELPGYVSNTIWNRSDHRLIIYLSNDYLAYTSYQKQIPFAIGSIFRSNKVQVPKMMASVELTKIIVSSSEEQLSHKINQIKNHPELFAIDAEGLKFLILKLDQMGNSQKANYIKLGFDID